MDAPNMNLATLTASISGLEKQLAHSRNRISRLHDHRQALEKETLAAFYRREKAAPVILDELAAVQQGIQAEEGAVRPQEEELAGLVRMATAHQRFAAVVEPAHIEHVQAARAHAWDWKA